MKLKFFPVRCTLSAVVIIITFSTITQGAPEDLSSEERARIAALGADNQRGVELNKAIALFGITKLRHYHAEVVSIKSAASGSGTEIELRADKLIYHQSGKPYFYTAGSDIKPRILRWNWSDPRAVPVCIGYRLSAYANAQDQVQRVSFGTLCDTCSILAVRRSNRNGSWDICLGCWIPGKKNYFLLQPNYLNLDESLEIEWNVKHGLAVGHFTAPYGGEFVFEAERGGQNWKGWPLVNAPGQYVRPGRDGWEVYKGNVDVPAAQFLAGPNWDVMRPVLALLESKDMPEPVRCEPTVPAAGTTVSRRSPTRGRELFTGTWEGTYCVDFKDIKQSSGPYPFKIIIDSSNAVSKVDWNSNTRKALPATPFCSSYVQEGPRTLVWHGPTWVNTFSMSEGGDTATFTEIMNSADTGSTRGALRRK